MSLFKSSAVEDERIACVSQVDNEEQVYLSEQDIAWLREEWTLIEGWMDSSNSMAPILAQPVPVQYFDYLITIKQMVATGASSGYGFFITNPELLFVTAGIAVVTCLVKFSFKNVDDDTWIRAHTRSKDMIDYENLNFSGFIDSYMQVHRLLGHALYSYWAIIFEKVSPIEQVALVGSVFFSFVVVFYAGRFVFRKLGTVNDSVLDSDESIDNPENFIDG